MNKETSFSTPLIVKWADYNQILFMKKFFSNKNITYKSIEKESFCAEGFGKYITVISAMIFKDYDSDFLQFITTVSNFKRTFNETLQYYQELKNNVEEDVEATPVPKRRGRSESCTIENRMLPDAIRQWPDTFERTRNRIIEACDFILDKCTNQDLVNSDLVNIKFPKVVEFFNLDENGAELLKFCYTFRSTDIKLPRDVQNFTSRMVQVSEMTGIDVKDIEGYASINSKSKQFYPFIIETVSVQDNVWNYLTNERADSLEECFYKVLDTDDALPKDFFDKIDIENTSNIIKLISGNTRIKRPRHILLYGKPGTGKTSYMKLISKLSGRKAYAITQAIDSSNRNSREYNIDVESRFMSITICDERVNSKKSIIVVDEADEMINCQSIHFGYDTHTKSLLNQVMDDVETPVIWITNNSPFMIDPSCRRRFDYSVYFDNFNEKQRALIWNNTVKLFKLEDKITPQIVDELAAEYPITPGGISSACKSLIDINPSNNKVKNTLDVLLSKHCELLDITPTKEMNAKFLPVKNYDLSALNITSTIPLKNVEKICSKYLDQKNKGQIERSLCILLSGPSGTGKTEFCKYLGSVLKKPVRIVRGSDVLDKYVGETEKIIAQIFKESEDNNNILFMDEVDGLLGGREKTNAAWEVSRVNEILQQMENYRGIFIAATNFSENIDSASIRRFAFKFTFDYLTENGIISMYENYFGKLKSTDNFYSKIKNLRMVTPGDFAIVKMHSEYAMEKITSEWIYNALKSEVNAKKNNSGFKSIKPKNMGY